MKTTTRLTWLAILVLAFTTLSSRAARDEDDRIAWAARHSYAFRTYLKDDHILINAKDGAVTLTGEVAGSSHRSMAQDTVENLPGVRSVDNQLVVKPANEKADALVAFQVKATLLYHRSVSGTRTDVSVKGGVVTLTGTATSEAQKELTTEYARDVEGVKDVKNELKVIAEPAVHSLGELIDDASITAQVKAALVTHRSTSALKTKVTTRNGVVTLKGQAKNQAEKDLVTKITSDIKGVNSVANEMEVTPAGR
jgi:hyperosmotically inducible periplasmic protein